MAEWQRDQFQRLKENLPDDWVIATMDFAENFLCKFQDEPQSADWAYKQVTVFPGWEQLVTRLLLKVSFRWLC